LKLQNNVILLVVQILKIQNIRFVGSLIPSSSYEFYDDETFNSTTLPLKYSHNEQRAVVVFLWAKKLMQIRFTLRRMQYMAQVLYEANSLRLV